MEPAGSQLQGLIVKRGGSSEHTQLAAAREAFLLNRASGTS